MSPPPPCPLLLFASVVWYDTGGCSSASAGGGPLRSPAGVHGVESQGASSRPHLPGIPFPYPYANPAVRGEIRTEQNRTEPHMRGVRRCSVDPTVSVGMVQWTCFLCPFLGREVLILSLPDSAVSLVATCRRKGGERGAGGYQSGTLIIEVLELKHCVGFLERTGHSTTSES